MESQLFGGETKATTKVANKMKKTPATMVTVTKCFRRKHLVRRSRATAPLRKTLIETTKDAQQINPQATTSGTNASAWNKLSTSVRTKTMTPQITAAAIAASRQSIS